MRPPTRLAREAGQVLPIAALFMFALLLFAALAVDVTSVLSAERFYTTTADASALAGAQDLQKGTTKVITNTERTRARTHAMDVLWRELGADFKPVVGACAPDSDITECALPGTPYLVSVVTPAPHCVRCDVNRALKVTVRNPTYDLSFANLVGQGSWNVESSAVAALEFKGNYALIALKPVDSNFQDGVRGNGSGTVIKVDGGDIGTNTNAELNSATFDIAPGYDIHYLDDSVGMQWGPPPPGVLNQSEIPDPQPPAPSFDGADTWDAQADGVVACPDEVIALDTVPDDVVCYAPGIYRKIKNNDRFEVGNSDKTYLLPGAFKFEGGMDVGGWLYGGLVANQPGVILYIPSDEELDANNAEAMVLNTAATAPQDWSDPPADMVNDKGLMVTIYSPRIEACFNGTIPIECPKEEDKNEPDIKLAGQSELSIKGVVYTPTKAIGIRGGSGTNAIDGQIIGWTQEWSGGSTLNLTYPDSDGIGLLRLDAACTGAEAC